MTKRTIMEKLLDKNQNDRQRILLVRTTPMPDFLKAVGIVRKRFEGSEIIIITQEGTENALQDQLGLTDIITVPTGYFRLKYLSKKIRTKIRTIEPSLAIFPVIATTGGGFFHWKIAMWYLGIPTLMLDHELASFTRLTIINSTRLATWLTGISGFLLFLIALIPAFGYLRIRQRLARGEKSDFYNVMFVVHEAELNGSGISLLSVLKMMKTKKFRPIVCAPAEGPLIDRLRSAGIEVMILAGSQLLRQRFSYGIFIKDLILFVRSVPRFVKLILERNIDLVHVNVSTIPDGLVAAWLCGVPGILHFREYLYESNWKTFQLFIIGCFASRIIAISDYCRSVVAEEISGERITTIHNGIEVADFFAGVSEAEQNRAERTEKKSVDIITLGNVNPTKGQHVLIGALAIAGKTLSELRAVIVGKCDNNDYEMLLKNLIAKNGLINSVTLAGFSDNVAELLMESDIVVIPSCWEEPFARVALEAMAAGKPVIASSSGGLPEVVAHDVTGLLFPTADESALAEAIVTLAQSPEKRREMGRQGRLRVQDRFSADCVTRSIEHLYEEMLA